VEYSIIKSERMNKFLGNQNPTALFPEPTY
jgi:hypothetical protein